MEKGMSILMRGWILAASVLAVLLLTGSSYAQIPDAPSETTQAVLSPQQRQWLERHNPIRIGVTFIPPQVLRDHQNGTLSGLCIDFMNEIEKTLPCRFEVVYFDTWAAMMEAAFAREIDVIYAAQKTPSRKEAFLFTQPYLDFDNKIVTRQDTERPLTLEDLAGKTVTVVKGAAIEEYLQGHYPTIQLLGVDDELEGLMRVSFNQADAMVIEIARASWYIQQKKFTNLHIAGDANYAFHLGFACRSDWPLLRDILDAGLATISPKRREALVRHWVPLPEKGILDMRLVIAAVGGIVLILLAVFVWNRMLRRQVHRRTLELNQETEAHEKDFAILKRFETIISLSDDLMVFVDRDFVYRAANEAYLKTVNKTHRQVIGYTVADVVGQELFDSVLRPHIEEALCGKIVTYERWFDFDHTERRYLQAVYHPYKNAAGVIEGIVVVLHDTTDHKRAEQSLQDSEARYREAIELAVDGILLGDADGKITGANSQLLKLIGKPLDEIIGSHISTFFDPKLLADKPLRFDLLNEGQTVITEREVLRADGAPLIVEMHSKKMPDGTYQSIIRDITERKQAEEAQKESEEKYRTLVDQAAEMLFLHDLEGTLIDVNQAAVQATGYTREQLLQMTVYDIDPDTEMRRDKKHLWETLPLYVPKKFEVRHKRKDGSVYWAEVRARKLLIKGKPYILALANDITERRRAEEEREKLLKELQHKNEELDNILFIASHDLKGPLVNVQGFAGELEKSLAQLRAALDDATRDKLAVLLETDIPESLYFIKGGSQKINQLLNGLLRLNRVGTAGLNPILLDIDAMIGDIIGDLRFKIRENDIDIAIEGTLPPCPGDATLVKQVFANLVENAVKYCQPDRPCRIRIRGCQKDNHCLYQVEDNGIGIAPEHTEKVFELFHQLSPGRGGEGLGLTIVRRVLDRLGGKVRIDSEVGKGTTVSVMLPCKG